MKSRDSRVGSALVLVALAGVMLAGVAEAHMDCFYPVDDPSCTAPGPKKACRINVVTAVASAPSPNVLLWARTECYAGSQDTTYFACYMRNTTGSDWVYATGGHNAQNWPNPGDVESFKCQVYGVRSYAGPPQFGTSVLPDTLSAMVGLYGPGGGIPSNIVTSDSAFVLQVTRSVSDSSVALRVGGPLGMGGMQTSALSGKQQSVAEVKMIVYPDSMTANADQGALGIGASYFGAVGLLGAKGEIFTKGAARASDWIVTVQSGKWTARPKPGVVINVPVPSPNAAVIRVVGDARSEEFTPIQTPLTLVLMSLALLGSGVLALRSRRVSKPV